MGTAKSFIGIGRMVLLSCGIALAVWGIPALADAATAPPTPTSLTNCGGSLTHDPSGQGQGEPYLLDYRFACDTPISAYTIVVGQQGDGGGAIDDYNPAPSVFESDGVTPSSTTAVTCEGTTPSDGINCNFGAGGMLTPGFNVVGSVDPIQTYCAHYPTNSKGKVEKAGTPTVPRAVVQLVVTDNTGAQDGPFQLGAAFKCPKVKNVVPKSLKTSRTKHKKHS